MKIDPRIDEPQKLSEIPRVERIEPSRDESLRHLSGRPTDLFDHAALEQGSSRGHAIAHRADASFTSTGQGKTRDGRHPRGLRTCSILTLRWRADHQYFPRNAMCLAGRVARFAQSSSIDGVSGPRQMPSR